MSTLDTYTHTSNNTIGNNTIGNNTIGNNTIGNNTNASKKQSCYSLFFLPNILLPTHRSIHPSHRPSVPPVRRKIEQERHPTNHGPSQKENALSYQSLREEK